MADMHRWISRSSTIVFIMAFQLIAQADDVSLDDASLVDYVSPHEAANAIDTLLEEESATFSKSDSTKANRRIDDYGFLRRASFDITGQLPTLDAIDQFVSDTNSDKRTSLIEKLLEDPRFGSNWASYWRDVIMYRRTEERAVIAGPTVTKYLAEAFNENTPWDELARSFITASGDIREDGQTAIIAAQGGRPEESVAELSRIFMGVQIQCAQCHDHPTDRWSRQQFHELAAFYPRTFMRPDRGGGQRTFLVTARDRTMRRVPKGDRHLGKMQHYMPDLDDPAAPGTLMRPVFFLNDEQLELSATDVQRRQALAEWMTSPANEWFAKALVSRVWSELVGTYFYPNVDDIGPDRTAVYPRTLDYLAASFVGSGHDMKWLFRTITATELYHRESRSRHDASQSDFSAVGQQRLRADQLFQALTQFVALDQPAIKRRLDRLGPRPRFGFGTVFGFDPSAPREQVNGSIPQALVLMNSPMIERLVSGARRDGGLRRLLREHPDDTSLIRQFYLRAFTRLPSRREIAMIEGHLRSASSREDAYEDLMWAMLNSSEFIHRG